MKIEKGIHAGTIRLSLYIQSLDVETHSVMTDNEPYFLGLAVEMQKTALEYLRTKPHAAVIPPTILDLFTGDPWVASEDDEDSHCFWCGSDESTAGHEPECPWLAEHQRRLRGTK